MARHRTTPGTRGAAAALLSALVPGFGQLYLGHRRRGMVLLVVTGLLVVGAGAVVAGGLSNLLEVLVRPEVLIGIFIGNIVLFLFRAWAVFDAYRLGAGQPARMLRSEVAGLMILSAVVLVLVPHAYVGYVDMVAHRTITGLFAETPTGTTATTTESSTSDTSNGVTVGSSTTTTQPTTTTTLAPLWEGKGRLNVLLLGGDAGIGRRGIRTDTMIVASVDPDSGDIAMFQIPRNFVQIPVPRGLAGFDTFPDLANAIYQYGLQHPELEPDATDPGAAFIKQVFSEFLGIPIHYYALVDLQGFVDMVDALGGVTIYVPQRVYDEEYPHEDGTTEVIDIPPGIYHMDGHLALAYARSRHGSDDYNRMGRQRCVLEAILKEADPVTFALRLGPISDAVQKYVTTDIPIEQLPNLVKLLPKVDSDRIVSVRFLPPDYVAGHDKNRYSIPNVAKVQETVATAVNLPADEAMAVLGIEPLSSTCEMPQPTTTTTEATTTTTEPGTTTTSEAGTTTTGAESTTSTTTP